MLEVYKGAIIVALIIFISVGLYLSVTKWIRPSKVYRRMIAFIFRKPYLYTLESDYVCPYKTNAKDAEYDWVSIVGGMMTVKAGYSWNGCSPKRNIMDLVFTGTPEGVIDYKTGKPKTYYASLCHDARYQYKTGTKNNADCCFLTMLEDAEFALAKAFYWAVDTFGTKWD